MKKILCAALSAFTIAFCGCTKNIDGEKRSSEALNSRQNEAEQSPEADRASVRDEVFEDIGADAALFEGLHGKIAEAVWEEGALYRFSDSGRWYSFSEYTFDGDSYMPGGKCTVVIAPLYEVINSPAGVYDIDTVSQATGGKISRGYSEIDEMYYYEAYYDGYKLLIYADRDGGISENSNVEISEIKED